MSEEVNQVVYWYMSEPGVFVGWVIQKVNKRGDQIGDAQYAPNEAQAKQRAEKTASEYAVRVKRL